jgi:hypothetical protein
MPCVRQHGSVIPGDDVTGKRAATTQRRGVDAAGNGSHSPARAENALSGLLPSTTMRVGTATLSWVPLPS